MSEINIEKIMDEIREEIRQKGYTDDLPSFDETENPEQTGCLYSEAEYQALLQELNTSYNIAWYRDLEGGFLSRFLKKVVRKLTSFLGVPVVVDQSGFNASVTREFNQLAGYIREQKEELDRCHQEIALLTDKVQALEKSLNENLDKNQDNA
ncbi:MAG: hypothetical protein LUI14_01825 [Lachnospiraceae bacterium]|nr:hypothetical protein [Lachnospiraceae bacterium]MCD7765584.1 hypothetical protein [Lachnospiraceae bacterium]